MTRHENGRLQIEFPDPAAIPTPSSVWGLMKQEDIEEGLLEILSADYEMAVKARKQLLEKLAPLVGFRPESLIRASAESNLQKIRKRIHSRDFEIYRDDVVCHWLIRCHREMLVDFLDACGIPHNDGFVADEYDESPSGESLVHGIRVIALRYPYRPVIIYLGYFYVWGTGFWEEIPPAYHISEDVLRALREKEATELGFAGKEADPDDAPKREGDDLPETSDRFTPLDNILIRSAVATAADDLGSLSIEELQELIEEAVRLNSARSHTVFHRGFYDALFTTATEYGSAAENDERRKWYLTGLLMGMLRRDKTAEILALLKQREGVFQDICDDETSRCGVMLLPRLFPILWECAENEMSFRLLRGQLPRLSEGARMRMAIDVSSNATALLRRGNAEISGNFLNLLDRLVKVEKNFSQEFRNYFIPRNDRRRAQVFMLRGELPAASRLLQPLLDIEDDELAAEAAGDLALVKGSFRSLQSLFPLMTPEDAKAKARALQVGKDYFLKSISKDGHGSSNARLCLGIVALFGNASNPAESSDQFSSALAGMMDRASLYEVGGIMGWTRILHVLSILENSDESGVFQVRAVLAEIRDKGEKYPSWILGKMLAAASVFDDRSFAAEIAELMLAQEGETAFDAIWESGLPLQIPELGAKYCDWMKRVEMSVNAKWLRCKNLLKFMLKEGMNEDAESILDELEVMAMRRSANADEFIKLLEDESNFFPAWGHSDAELCRINLADKHGRTEEARGLLINRFHDKRTGGNPTDLQEAEGILDWLKDLNEDDAQLEILGHLIRPDDNASAVPEDRLVCLQGSILFIGGNEIQAQYNASVINDVKKECPGVEIQFINPGWSSNWNKHLDDIRHRLPEVNAVVLSPLVRTQLGRSIRKECDDTKPWFPCTGRGKASIVRSIMNAARWMASK